MEHIDSFAKQVQAIHDYVSKGRIATIDGASLDVASVVAVSR